ncbi:hypothetical protein [Xanthomonas arboricola]|uniref:hypothetical protein n=1 Tax=Xanthomonas arboricola TaxID=56448 RepID=UPI000F8DF44E|nr:hypothetical protein [Xanthomonas arboricola]
MFFLTRTAAAMRCIAIAHVWTQLITPLKTSNTRWRNIHHDACKRVMADGGAQAASLSAAMEERCGLLRSIAATCKAQVTARAMPDYLSVFRNDKAACCEPESTGAVA